MNCHESLFTPAISNLFRHSRRKNPVTTSPRKLLQRFFSAKAMAIAAGRRADLTRTKRVRLAVAWPVALAS
jgi:hypothetical protein